MCRACPTDSLTEMREAIGYADENRVKHNFPYVNGGEDNVYFRKRFKRKIQRNK